MPCVVVVMVQLPLGSTAFIVCVPLAVRALTTPLVTLMLRVWEARVGAVRLHPVVQLLLTASQSSRPQAFAHAVEAMECIGGSGVMEDGPFPRLYREAPMLMIGEGTADIQRMIIARRLLEDYKLRG